MKHGGAAKTAFASPSADNPSIVAKRRGLGHVHETGHERIRRGGELPRSKGIARALVVAVHMIGYHVVIIPPLKPIGTLRLSRQMGIDRVLKPPCFQVVGNGVRPASLS